MAIVDLWIWLVLTPFVAARWTVDHPHVCLIGLPLLLGVLAWATLGGFAGLAGILARVLGALAAIIAAAWFAALSLATAALGLTDAPAAAWASGGASGAFVGVVIVLGALLWLWVAGRTVVGAALWLARAGRAAAGGA